MARVRALGLIFLVHELVLDRYLGSGKILLFSLVIEARKGLRRDYLLSGRLLYCLRGSDLRAEAANPGGLLRLLVVFTTVLHVTVIERLALVVLGLPVVRLLVRARFRFIIIVAINRLRLVSRLIFQLSSRLLIIYILSPQFVCLIGAHRSEPCMGRPIEAPHGLAGLRSVVQLFSQYVDRGLFLIFAIGQILVVSLPLNFAPHR